MPTLLLILEEKISIFKTYWVQRSELFNMELAYISCVLIYSSETLSATSLPFSVTVWVSVRVCERSINDDGLTAVCTANTVSVIKSQQCRIVHSAERKYWTFVASIVLKDGSFLLLIHERSSRFTRRHAFQECYIPDFWACRSKLVELDSKQVPGKSFRRHCCILSELKH